MVKVEGSVFKDTTVQLDGFEYVGCIFERCQIVYNGTAQPLLRNNRFIDTKWTFAGSAANTIQFLTEMRRAGNTAMVDDIIAKIRGERPLE